LSSADPENDIAAPKERARKKYMKARLLIASALIIGMFDFAVTAQTNDTYPVLKTLDGKVYTNAEVISVTHSYLTVFFDGGGVRIDLTNLSPEIQKRYHFDAGAAAAASEARRQEGTFIAGIPATARPDTTRPKLERRSCKGSRPLNECGNLRV
jgi:hypothetical protein